MSLLGCRLNTPRVIALVYAIAGALLCAAWLPSINLDNASAGAILAAAAVLLLTASGLALGRVWGRPMAVIIAVGSVLLGALLMLGSLAFFTTLIWQLALLGPVGLVMAWGGWRLARAASRLPRGTAAMSRADVLLAGGLLAAWALAVAARVAITDAWYSY